MDGQKKYTHGGNVYLASREKDVAQENLLDFSANINPVGLSAGVRAAMLNNIEAVIHYPDPGATDFKRSISNYYSVKTENITAGNGAVELMYILCHMLKPKRVLVLAPTFSEYERAAIAANAQVEYFYLLSEQKFAVNIPELIKRISAVDIVFIGNPNNPTGKLVPREDLEFLLRSAQFSNTLVVIDESFLDFLPDDSLYTCRPLISQYENLVIIQSLTKFYAIPGLRLGFSLANNWITDRLQQGKDPWNVNTLAQAAGIAALTDKEYQQRSRDYIQQARSGFFKQLLTLPFQVYEPSVNFILLDVSSCGFTAAKMQKKMFEYRILIRNCSNYIGLSDGFIRLAVKTPEQNHAVINAFNMIIKGERK